MVDLAKKEHKSAQVQYQPEKVQPDAMKPEAAPSEEKEQGRQKDKKKESFLSDTSQLTGMAMFAAIVVILQLMGSFIRFGPFAISLVLVPIIIGASMYGPTAGAVLGLIFGVVVLVSGDAAAFLAINVPAAIGVCTVKGTLCGWCAGLVYSFFRERKNRSELFSTAAAAVVCPVVNTGVFLIFCKLFFMETITGWGQAAGFRSAGAYLIFGMVGINFVIELVVNSILTPTVVRLIKMAEKY